MGAEWGADWVGIAIRVGLGVATLAVIASRLVRLDGVAVLALALAVLLGVVPPGQALSGLAEPVVVTIAALSVLAAAVFRSGLIDLPRSALARRWRLTAPVLLAGGVLTAALAGLSGRVGTRDAVRRVSRLHAVPPGPATLLLDVACLLGGTLTAVGAVPNLLVSTVRARATGAPFDVLAFAPVGALLLLAGLLLFALAAVLGRAGAADRRDGRVDGLRRVQSFTVEAVLPPGSPMDGRMIAALEAAGENSFNVLALVREGFRRVEARPDWALQGGDVLVLDCEPSVLQRLMERFGLQPTDGALRPSPVSGTALIEAVVTQSSELVGRPSAAGGLGPAAGVQLLGIGRNDGHPPGRLRRTRLRAGDILVLAAEADAAPGALAAMGCLPLAERRLRLGRNRLAALPLVVLVGALLVATLGDAPLWLSLLGGAVLLVLSRTVTLSEVYEAVPWPGLVALAALLPLAAGLHDAAASAALARAIAPQAALAGSLVTTAGTVAASMGATALFGAAVGALLVAPFALSLAVASGLPVDMLLMAVAVGASVDMLDRRGIAAALLPGLRAPSGHLRWLLDRGRLLVAAFLLAVGSAAVAFVWR